MIDLYCGSSANFHNKATASPQITSFEVTVLLLFVLLCDYDNNYVKDERKANGINKSRSSFAHLASMVLFVRVLLSILL